MTTMANGACPSDLLAEMINTASEDVILSKLPTSGIELVWEKVYQEYLRLKDWYQDNELYHKIGYLVSSGYMNMGEIIALAKNKRKSELMYHIDLKIKDSVDFNLGESSYPYTKRLSELSYENGEERQCIKRILLLFNVLSVLRENVYQRFPFSKFNESDWTLEHIHAQNPKNLNIPEQWVEWIKRHLKPIEENLSNDDAVERQKVIRMMKEYIANPKKQTRTSFEMIHASACKYLTDDITGEYLHSLSNMALLSHGDNSSISNNAFYVKREEIINLDKKGSFIPYCTKMVFLKYYSKNSNVKFYFWDKKDRQDYLEAMKTILGDYISNIEDKF